MMTFVLQAIKNDKTENQVKTIAETMPQSLQQKKASKTENNRLSRKKLSRRKNNKTQKKVKAIAAKVL